MTFYIDDIAQTTTIIGELASKSFPVSAGSHTFKWIFNTNGGASGWIDYIIMPK